MADYPAIYAGAMVSALLAGRKTQTRRLVKSPLAKCQPGDRLWVRENLDQKAGFLRYSATHDAVAMDQNGALDWLNRRKQKSVPAIHMPRWASRITLVVTDLRRQPLHDISEADAQAEGPIKLPATGRFVTARGQQYFDLAYWTALGWYAALWDELHGHGSWDENPEVVAITFTVHRVNIDQFKE